MTVETLEQFNEIRRKILADEPVTREEVKAGIDWLKRDRVAAQAKAAKTKSNGGGKTEVNLDTLFAGLNL